MKGCQNSTTKMEKSLRARARARTCSQTNILCHIYAFARARTRAFFRARAHTPHTHARTQKMLSKAEIQKYDRLIRRVRRRPDCWDSIKTEFDINLKKLFVDHLRLCQKKNCGLCFKLKKRVLAVKKRKRCWRKLRCIFKFVVFMIFARARAAEKIYLPGGDGAKAAAKNFAFFAEK